MLGIADIGAFCAAVLIFLALPGPGTFALLSSTAQGGFRAGAAATFGVIVGDQLLLWLAVGGVATVLNTNPEAFRWVQWAGAAYLVWIGGHLLLARPGGASPITIKPHHYFRQALLITVLNPKAIVFYMAFFPVFIDPARHRGVVTFAAMAAIIALITAAYCLSLCAFAQQLAPQIRSRPTLVRGLRLFAGFCVLGFALRLLIS